MKNTSATGLKGGSIIQTKFEVILLELRDIKYYE
jgi:hypothetical protein